LIPHAEAEDAVLYPVVEQVMNAPAATATMSRDHVEVARLTADLQRLRDSLQGSSDPALRRQLQRILYGLYAIIRLHFAKEEEIYLPLLDAGLAPADADEMFHAMHEHVHASGSATHAPEHR
jgi:iron-sulfur cluster repair protein YtfE (RIC family)